jgi:hypothetical protein
MKCAGKIYSTFKCRRAFLPLQRLKDILIHCVFRDISDVRNHLVELPKYEVEAQN